MEKEKEETTTTWEIKDRNYYLLNNRTPLTYTITSKHTRRFPLLYFDKEQGRQRELRYATNQASPFVDEQNGQVTLEHIIFHDGALHVPKEKQNLQKLLSLYHPLVGKRFQEINQVAIAKDEIKDIELEILALTSAQQMDIEQAEAILRVEQGSSVSDLSSKEIKRDILLFARKNPKLLIDLANDDNVVLRNFAIKAVELGIMGLARSKNIYLG